MTNSAQLENEAERTRADLANTLRELRARLTVGQVVDEVWHFTRDSFGRNFARNLGRQVTDNPIPSALVGAGLAWLMFARSSREKSARRHERLDRRANGDGEIYSTYESSVMHARKPNGNGHKMSDTIGKAQSTMSETASNAASAAKDAASTIGEKASQAAHTIGETASSAYENVTEGASRAASAIGDTASTAYHNVEEGASRIAKRTGDAARSFADYCVEHPMVIAGAGLALGAAIGAALPLTRPENRLFGETSDKMKRSAERMASEQLERAEQGAEQAIDKVADAADRQFMRSKEAPDMRQDETRH